MKNNDQIMKEKKEEILKNLTISIGIVTLACRLSKVGRTTFYEYKKSDPEFAFKVDEIEAGFIDFVETRLMDMVKLGDRAATIFYLKAKAKDRGYY